MDTSLLLVLCGRDPYEAVVAEDDAGAARQLVEVDLPPLDQAGGHLDERALGELPVLERSALMKEDSLICWNRNSAVGISSNLV